MRLTRHALERYRDFWMADRPGATLRDAYEVLSAAIPSAIRQDYRTHTGDEVWRIEALGIELVIKRDRPDDPSDVPVCVTILPPARLRGLTPEQAERVREMAVEVTEVARKLREEREAANQRLSKTKESLTKDERRREDQEIAKLKLRLRAAEAERDAVLAIVKADRDRRIPDLESALRAALRFIQGNDRRRVLGEDTVRLTATIAHIDPDLMSHKFIWADDPMVPK